MKNINCNNCGSEIRVIDHKKRGAISILLAIPFLIITLYISKGTILPFVSFALFVAIGIFFFLKKDRYTYWCKKCVLKTDSIGNAV